MIADAVDTATSIGWALFAWLFAAAFVVVFLLLSVSGVVWAVPEAACRGVAGALAASAALRGLGEGAGASVASEGRTAALAVAGSPAVAPRTDRVAPLAPELPTGVPESPGPAQRRSAPHTPAWALTDEEAA